ncbi:hypothetical protein [Alicyclobacillus sp. ALC3]|uniref:hypothetical protein n=1 Tax=Alicyclobacillus sp. ALC3 TaxID=2796143 RepID=UPI0023789A98|nr:hypothetical protein [Alicyclobacillus sp. ALC3]WDL98802.1 hypothetical protein JC200_09195 [Alicyclobacillus sp. ALC3]
MRTGFIAEGVALILVTLSGCATAPSYRTGMPTGGMMGTYGSYSSNQTVNSSSGANTSISDSPDAKQHVHLTILPGMKLGPDGKKHDAFSPANFTLMRGVQTEIIIYNYDDMPHSLTDPALGLNVQAAPSKESGRPGVTTVTFTPTHAGTSTWRCVDPCDLDNGQWAMSHPGYMTGSITVE